MAKKFKAVFIMEDGEYKEITNEEHQLRKAEDEEYKRKYFRSCHRIVDESKV